MPRTGATAADRAFAVRRRNEQASIWCFFSIAQIAAMFVGVLLMGSDKGEAASGPRARASGAAIKGRKSA